MLLSFHSRESNSLLPTLAFFIGVRGAALDPSYITDPIFATFSLAFLRSIYKGVVRGGGSSFRRFLFSEPDSESRDSQLGTYGPQAMVEDFFVWLVITAS